MNACRPSGWVLTLVCAAVVSAAKAGAADAKSAATSRSTGDKIEFTQPREVAPVRPMTGTDLQGRSFNTTPRDTPADGANMITSMPLPAPADVNRLRLLQQMLTRRGQADGTGPGGFGGGSAMSLDGGLDPQVEGAGTRLTIDDLFDRQRGRLAVEDRENGDNRRPGANREDRSGGPDRGSNSDRSGDRAKDLANRKDLSADSSERGSKMTGNGNAATSESGRDTRFLPGLRAGEDEFRDSLLGRQRGVVEGSEPSSERLSGRFGASLDDRDDPAQSRAERMEAFRRMLGGGTSVDSWLSPASRAASTGSQAVPGGVGAPGAASGGARTLGAALEGRGGFGGAAAASSAGSEAATDRTFAVPLRPLELNLGTGRGALGAGDSSAAGAAPIVRPMELFQEKHDSRLPTRGF